jgi:hypothetical protein
LRSNGLARREGERSFRDDLGNQAGYARNVPRNQRSRRFAERSLTGIDDEGNQEKIVLWIEYGSDAQWAVGRAVDPEHRPGDDPRDGDYIFRGFELDDALNEANGALDDDLRVSREEGIEQSADPFDREEILERLEHWFFHRDDQAGG